MFENIKVTYMPSKLEIIEGLSDEDLAQQLADLTYEVLKLIGSGQLNKIAELHEDLEMAHNEWEYRNDNA